MLSLSINKPRETDIYGDYDTKIEETPDLRPGANSQGIMGLSRR
jgi:hypothetical protein